MRYVWPYVFCLFIFGGAGLYLGRISRSGEVSILKEWISYVPAVIEKQLIIYKFIPVPYKENEKNQKISATDTRQALLVEQDTKINVTSAAIADANYMKQIAHVHVPQENNLTDVSKPLSYSHEAQDLHATYKKQVEHMCTLLRSVNHAHKPVRVLARLQLADVCVEGPLGKYMQELASSLLVRYCDDTGKLVQSDVDEYVEADINKAIALLQAQQEHDGDWGSIARIEFAPIQRRVQRHAANGALKTALTSSYIPYTAG